MDVKGGEPLALSLYARGDVPLIVRVESADNKILCEKHFHPKETWRKLAATVTPKASAKKAHLLILAAKAGTAEIDYVSLMPAETFKGHGLRKDIAQLIADLKPANFRFPGGCMLESCDYAGWFDWKRTVGAPETRQPLWNIWGYYQNVGLGFYEYFVFCEDIGAEPLPVFIGGRTCQFRNSKLFPKENLGWLVTNMLDAVEFIRGPTNTTWGALRAKMGHPAPFPLKTIGIGNENWGKAARKGELGGDPEGRGGLRGRAHVRLAELLAQPHGPLRFVSARPRAGVHRRVGHARHPSRLD